MSVTPSRHHGTRARLAALAGAAALAATGIRSGRTGQEPGTGLRNRVMPPGRARRLTAAVTAVLALALALITAGSAPAWAYPGQSVTLSQATVAPGGTITITASGTSDGSYTGAQIGLYRQPGGLDTITTVTACPTTCTTFSGLGYFVSIGDLSPGQPFSVSITLQINPGTPNTSFDIRNQFLTNGQGNDATVDGPALTIATPPFPFGGYLAPVASPPTLNMVHAGQGVPVQFSLGGDQGMNILAAGSPTATQVSCATGVPVNTATMTDTAGGSGLQFDSTTGDYTYVWKTSRSWAGTCQEFTITLTDGTSHTALFQF